MVKLDAKEPRYVNTKVIAVMRAAVAPGSLQNQ